MTKYDLQKISDTGEFSLYFELKSAKQFKDFLDSDRCKQRISEGGLEALRAEFMERLEEKKSRSEKKRPDRVLGAFSSA